MSINQSQMGWICEQTEVWKVREWSRIMEFDEDRFCDDKRASHPVGRSILLGCSKVESHVVGVWVLYPVVGQR